MDTWSITASSEHALDDACACAKIRAPEAVDARGGSSPIAVGDALGPPDV